MKINEVLIKEIPTYADPSQFYAGGGKDLYQEFRKTFPKLPEKVADDIWHQKQPGKDPLVTNQLKKGVEASKAFISYFTGRLFSAGGGDPLTGLTSEQLEKVLLEAIWQSRMLEVNPASFTEHSRNKMIKRNFGSAPGEDPVRIKRAGMSNDPVTLIESTQQGGYIMWEGWHRTMVKLKSGSDGTNN